MYKIDYNVNSAGIVFTNVPTVAEVLAKYAKPVDWSDIPAELAAKRSAAAIAGFFRKVMLGAEPFVVGVRGAVGLGKTAAVIEQLVNPALADKFVNFYAPEHRLNGELLERFDAAKVPGSPRARAVFGRDQVMPDGTPMCQKAELARQVQALGQPVQSNLCWRGPHDRCEHFDTCPYQAQRMDKEPGIRFMAHAHLFIGANEGAPKPDAVVIDESFWQASLRGQDDKFFIPMPRLESVREVPDAEGDRISASDTRELAEISGRCAKAIKAGGKLRDFVEAGVTSTIAGRAMVLEYDRIEELNISPGMAIGRQEAVVSRCTTSEALKFARFFRLLHKSLGAGIDPKFFDYRPEAITKEGTIEARLYLVWSTDLKVGVDIPTLLIDANLESEIIRRFLPAMGEPVVANARLSAYRAVQITDHAVPKARLEPIERDQAENQRRANRRAELRRLAEVEGAKGKVLFVTYRSVEEALREEMAARGDAPKGNVHFAHWNALRGHDEWRDVDTLIVAGRPQPNVESIERMARALWYLDGRPIEAIELDEKGDRRFHKETRAIALADGNRLGSEVDVHPDGRCTLLMDQVRAEVMQAVGRARLVWRQGKPCRVFILTSYPLPMLVHEASTWNDIMPNPLAVMQARGIVPERKRDADKVLSDMFPNGGIEDWILTRPKVAEAWGSLFSESWEKPPLTIPISPIGHTIGDFGIVTPCNSQLSWKEVRYRVRGDKQAARALVDTGKHPDPAAAIAAHLGAPEIIGGDGGKADKLGTAMDCILAEIGRAQAANDPHTKGRLRAMAGADGPLKANEKTVALLIGRGMADGRIVEIGKRAGGALLGLSAERINSAA